MISVCLPVGLGVPAVPSGLALNPHRQPTVFSLAEDQVEDIRLVRAGRTWYRFAYMSEEQQEGH